MGLRVIANNIPSLSNMQIASTRPRDVLVRDDDYFGHRVSARRRRYL